MPNFHMELRVFNNDDPKKLEAIEKAFTKAARELHARAILIAGDGSMPTLRLHLEDLKTGKREISVYAK